MTTITSKSTHNSSDSINIPSGDAYLSHLFHFIASGAIRYATRDVSDTTHIFRPICMLSVLDLSVYLSNYVLCTTSHTHVHRVVEFICTCTWCIYSILRFMYMYVHNVSTYMIIYIFIYMIHLCLHEHNTWTWYSYIFKHMLHLHVHDTCTFS